MASMENLQPKMLEALREAGWYEERRVNLDLLEENCRKENVVLFEAARAFFSSFSGVSYCFYQASGSATIYEMPEQRPGINPWIYLNDLKNNEKFYKYKLLANYPVIYKLCPYAGDIFDVSSGDVMLLFDEQDDMHYFLDEMEMLGIIREPCFTVGRFYVDQVKYTLVLSQSGTFWVTDDCYGEYRSFRSAERMFSYLYEQAISPYRGRIYTKRDCQGQWEGWCGKDPTNRAAVACQKEILSYCQRHRIVLKDVETYIAEKGQDPLRLKFT